MACIKTYVHPTIGCTICIHDDALQCSPEERAARRRELDRTVAKLLQDPKTRREPAQVQPGTLWPHLTDRGFGRPERTSPGHKKRRQRALTAGRRKT